MQVKVLFFGVLRERAGASERQVELPSGATAGHLLEICAGGAAAESALWRSIAVAVNQQYVGRDRPLAEGDEVALLPPVSGGAVSGR